MIPDVVERRIADIESVRGNEPYSSIVRLEATSINPEPPIALLEIGFVEPYSVELWRNMIFNRDVNFLTW
jgi:hypothetical protein